MHDKKDQKYFLLGNYQIKQILEDLQKNSYKPTCILGLFFCLIFYKFYFCKSVEHKSVEFNTYIEIIQLKCK